MKLSHLDSNGKAKMVDVSSKRLTQRTAKASADVIVSKDVLQKIKDNSFVKGDIFAVAKIAGIQAGKKTSELIPLCHNIFISNIDIDFIIHEKQLCIEIISTAKTNSVTGIEMEALTSVSVAALTIYDMCKAVDKSIVISNIHLLSKTGGKSGSYSSPK